jgi:hypothetical protein
MTYDEFGEIREVWAELRTIYDEIDELNDPAGVTGIEVFGTDAAQRAST